jgi:cytochrome c553
VSRAVTKTSITPLLSAAALACTIALSACSKPAPEAADAKVAEAAHGSSSAGLPNGNAAMGKTLATTKGASGQACVDCHGADGNAPIDASYPKLGGQYADYIEHALQAYRGGTRGGSPTTDLMASQAKALSDQQIADLAAYYAGTPGQLRDLHGAD